MFDRVRRLFRRSPSPRVEVPDDWHQGDSAATKVLLEYPDYATPSVLASVLADEGYRVAVCEGPGDAPGTCRLLNDNACPLAEDADVIFNGLGLGAEEHRRILAELRATYPDTPVVVETTEPDAAAHTELLAGCTLSGSPLTSDRLRRSIEQARADQGPVEVHPGGVKAN
jgi:hypothetical protein